MASNQFVYRWAFLSRSSIASVFLPNIILPSEDLDSIMLKTVAVSTTGSNERVQKRLVEHKVPIMSSVKIYNPWEKMLQEGDFDVVYISTPHPPHYQHVLAAIKNKQNVLVEKPATMNHKQYELLCKHAREQNVVLMEAMWTRCMPTTKYFKKELVPKIGPVKRVYSEFSFAIYSLDMLLSSASSTRVPAPVLSSTKKSTLSAGRTSHLTTSTQTSPQPASSTLTTSLYEPETMKSMTSIQSFCLKLTAALGSKQQSES